MWLWKHGDYVNPETGMPCLGLNDSPPPPPFPSLGNRLVFTCRNNNINKNNPAADEHWPPLTGGFNGTASVPWPWLLVESRRPPVRPEPAAPAPRPPRWFPQPNTCYPGLVPCRGMEKVVHAAVIACLGSGFVQSVSCHLNYFLPELFINSAARCMRFPLIYFPPFFFFPRTMCLCFVLFSSAPLAEGGTMRTRISRTWRKLSASGVSIWKRN